MQIYTFPSRVNHYFYDNFLHFTREILRDTTRGTSRVCEVIVELYRSSSDDEDDSSEGSLVDDKETLDASEIAVGDMSYGNTVTLVLLQV